MSTASKKSPKSSKITKYETETTTSAAVTYTLWFLVTAIIAYIILHAWNPTLVQNTDAAGQPTGTVNVTRVLVGALIVAAIVTLLVWAIRKARS